MYMLVAFLCSTWSKLLEARSTYACHMLVLCFKTEIQGFGDLHLRGPAWGPWQQRRRKTCCDSIKLDLTL